MSNYDPLEQAIALLRDKFGKEYPLDIVVSELLADYDSKCQALAAKGKQEQEFHDFMEALAVKLKKANALTMAGALEEVEMNMALLQRAFTLLSHCTVIHESMFKDELELWLVEAKKANIK
jgi:hypothetical protein